VKPSGETGGDGTATGSAQTSVSPSCGTAHLTEDELIAWGHRIGATVTPPVFIGLIGPLGAGKSVLARAVARGAGVRGALPSPTFNIVFRYPVSGAAVIHADLFRIGSVQELAGIGWEDMLADRRGIVLVEWCGRAGSELPNNRWAVTLGFVEDVARREVRVVRFGEPSPLPGFCVPGEGAE